MKDMTGRDRGLSLGGHSRDPKYRVVSVLAYLRPSTLERGSGDCAALSNGT